MLECVEQTPSLTRNVGGTAGCIIASRLADADPNLSILVVEGGPNNHNDPMIIHPAFFFGNLAPGTKTISFYAGNKSEHLGNRELVVPTANILGGGSSVNFSLYSRAQRTDLEAWQTPGWSAGDLVPFMKKVFMPCTSLLLYHTLTVSARNVSRLNCKRPTRN